MEIELSTIPALIAGSLATLLVVFEQWKSSEPWKSTRLWFALICLVATMVAIVVESSTSKALDRERRADLILIQKQNTALNALCIELNLQPYDPKYDKGCSFQIELYSPVVAAISRTGHLGDIIHFQFHPDTGWFRSRHSILTWPLMKLQYDSTNQFVRFELMPFGIKSYPPNDVLLWKIERLGDLSQIRFGIQMRYSAHIIEQRDPPIYTDVCPPDLEWSPVKSIYIYSNSFESNNLIAKLSPRIRSYGDSHSWVWFHPERQPVKDPDNFKFNIDVYYMREHIINSLD